MIGSSNFLNQLQHGTIKQCKTQKEIKTKSV